MLRDKLELGDVSSDCIFFFTYIKVKDRVDRGEEGEWVEPDWSNYRH